MDKLIKRLKAQRNITCTTSAKNKLIAYLDENQIDRRYTQMFVGIWEITLE